MTTKQPPHVAQEFALKDLKRAFLVGVHPSGGNKGICDEHLEELERLCDSFGIPVIGKIACPIKKLDAGTYIGSGKIEEILQIANELEIDIIIFDDEISPHQQKNLEASFRRPVIDRTELIIEVFAKICLYELLCCLNAFAGFSYFFIINFSFLFLLLAQKVDM